MTKLDTYLREEGIRGRDFAKKLGLKEPYLSRIRRGHRRPNLDVAIMIARVTKGRVPVESWASSEAA